MTATSICVTIWEGNLRNANKNINCNTCPLSHPKSIRNGATLTLITLCDDRFWISISPFALNKKTLNARCNLMRPFSLTRWQSLLLDWPIARSQSSTRIQFSAKAVSWRFFACNWFAAAIPDTQRWLGVLPIKYVNEFRIKLLPNILPTKKTHKTALFFSSNWSNVFRLVVVCFGIRVQMPLFSIKLLTKLTNDNINAALHSQIRFTCEKLSVCIHVTMYTFVSSFSLWFSFLSKSKQYSTRFHEIPLHIFYQSVWPYHSTWNAIVWVVANIIIIIIVSCYLLNENNRKRTDRTKKLNEQHW